MGGIAILLSGGIFIQIKLTGYYPKRRGEVLYCPHDDESI
jgi:hypothetical protein